MGFTMTVEKSVQKSYDSSLLRFNICENCKGDFKTISQLSVELNVPKTKLRVGLDFLEKENYLTKKTYLDKNLCKWVNCYQASTKNFKQPDLLKMANDYNINKSNKNKLPAIGPYDALILANPNLRVIRMEDIKYQRADGVRKEKWRGIGSSFSMFDSA